jgi:hypothetical protein
VDISTAFLHGNSIILDGSFWVLMTLLIFRYNTIGFSWWDELVKTSTVYQISGKFVTIVRKNLE